MKIRSFTAAGPQTTQVPTAFLADEMPDAPADYVKVYLYGLYLSGAGTPETGVNMETRLHMKSSEIDDAFSYWEARGAVRISPNGTVHYRFGSADAEPAIEPFPFVAFNIQVADEFGRDPAPDDMRRIYGWLDNLGFPQEVALMLIRHCVERKGHQIGINYMDKIASVWAEHGVDTVEKAQNEIDEYRAGVSGARRVMRLMGIINRQPGKTEMDLYDKWTGEYGFTHEGIVRVMEGREFNMAAPFRYLDAILRDLHAKGVHTAQEIAQSEQENATEWGELKEVLRMLGYQGSGVQREHKETFRAWKADGFETPVILLACAQATRFENRRMERATELLASWRRRGLTTESSVRDMLAEQADLECRIQEVYEEAGIERSVSEIDTKVYRRYTTDCGMNHDVMMYAASLASTAENPFKYMHAILRRWADARVTTVPEARLECERHNAEKNRRSKQPAPYAQRAPVSAVEADQRSARALQVLKEKYGTS